MVSSAPVPLFEADREGRIARSNPAFAQLVGRSDRSDGRAVRLEGLLGAESWRGLLAAIEEHGTARHVGATLDRADGDRIPVELSVSSVHLPSGEVRLIGTVHDVSHLRPADAPPLEGPSAGASAPEEPAGDARAAPSDPTPPDPRTREHSEHV